MTEWGSAEPSVPTIAHRIRPTVTRKFRVGGWNREPTSIADRRAAERLVRILARLDAERGAA